MHTTALLQSVRKEKKMENDIKINWGDGVFAVPDKAGQSLKAASGKAVKVLLYLLYNKQLPEDTSVMGSGISDEDVEEAVCFWKQAGVICDEKPAAAETASVQTAAKPGKLPRFKQLTPVEIAENISANEDTRVLTEGAQAAFARPLTYDEQRTFIWLHDHCALPSEVMLTLLHFCISHGNSSMAYYETVAFDWAQRGINTHRQADEELIAIESHMRLEDQVKSLLNVKSLTKSQKQKVSGWDDISLDMIKIAYDRALEYTPTKPVDYMDSIICNWRKNGIATPEQALADAESFKAQKSGAKAKAEKSPKKQTNSDSGVITLSDSQREAMERAMQLMSSYGDDKN